MVATPQTRPSLGRQVGWLREAGLWAPANGRRYRWGIAGVQMLRYGGQDYHGRCVVCKLSEMGEIALCRRVVTAYHQGRWLLMRSGS